MRRRKGTVRIFDDHVVFALPLWFKIGDTTSFVWSPHLKVLGFASDLNMADYDWFEAFDLFCEVHRREGTLLAALHEFGWKMRPNGIGRLRMKPTPPNGYEYLVKRKYLTWPYPHEWVEKKT